MFDNKGYHIFCNNGTLQMDELCDISSDQEDAGTKMFLFAKYFALLGASSVCIHTVDTDVLVLSGNKLLLSLFQFFRANMERTQAYDKKDFIFE